ncbi:MAG: cobalt-precorrin-5B (C(1))-methyltransferase [Deltaproteobacteria bacterium]|jgi:cobalt-precorrin-5B (C1)-methyltransferase|nr:cobalt-precorrin-5B (C(1))-methyltransferase [Deltaproteobacteria bacterium]
MARKLRTGFTTGTAAAAAAKGALTSILEGKSPDKVRIRLLTGDDIFISIHRCERISDMEATCTVIKDAGDDPDVTHKAEIGAIVRLANTEPERTEQDRIQIFGGKGVGRVTKPGLEVPPGEPAINPGPRKMICEAVLDVLERHQTQYTLHVEVFVPEGEKLAEKTLNARLGILGGISILGTTGIVRPMSHDAFIATIQSAASVAHASGLEHVVFTTGRRSERFAQAYWPQLPEACFIQIGDFFKMSLECASKLGFKHISLAVFFGKATKMAQGIPHTHASKARLTMERLSEWSYDLTRDAQFSKRIMEANTARHAFDSISAHHPEIIHLVGKKIIRAAQSFVSKPVAIDGVIFDYNGGVVFDSTKRKT